MQITFYYAPMSSAVPVSSALAEVGVAHERITLDLTKQEQRSPEFLRINPNGKVPTLVVDGTPMFEGLAIAQWLGERFGVEQGLWPKPDAPELLTAKAWSTWAYVSYGAVVRQLYLATAPNAPAELKNDVWADHARAAVQDLLGVLDGHLAKTGFIAGEHFTLADVIVSGTVLYSRMLGVPLADHAHVSQWADLCGARPSIRKEFGG